MKNIAKYLIDNYYSKYPPAGPVPDEDMLIRALNINQDKVVVVHNEDKIIGVAIFMTLTDETYAKIKDINIFNVDTVSSMLQEEGDNLHFILVSGSSYRNIRTGIRAAIRERNPKTVSWFDPDNKMVHKYNLN